MLETLKDFRFTLLLVLVALLGLVSRLHSAVGLAATIVVFLIVAVLALRALWAVPPVIRSLRALKRAQREAASSEPMQ